VRLVRRHPFLSVFAVVLLAVVSVVGWSGVTVWRAAHHDDAEDVDSADAIVVLGAAQYNGRPSPVFRGRLDHALLLWQQGRSRLVVTVGSNRPGDAHTEAEAGKTYLVAQGVPADDVVDIPVGHTTLESLRAAAGFLRDSGLHSVFLVSDPWHNARVKAMADDLGLAGYASATWTSAATSEESRGEGYLRETFALAFFCTLHFGACW
jgi:uncharacterized SAM-binding protein YcdF (DUF218 family)